MPTTPNYSWPTPADSDYVKDGASAIRVLGDSIDTDLKQVADSVSSAAWSATTVAANESTTSTAYTDLTTIGPAVTVDIEASGAALVIVSARIYSDADGGQGLMTFDVSGATTVAGGDARALILTSPGVNLYNATSRLYHVTGLVAGSNTFTSKYRRLGGTQATFGYRGIAVLPL